MRGKTLIALFAVFMLSNVFAQQYEWAKSGGLWAYDYGYGITTDKLGRVYIAGKYEKNANFSGTILPCEGNHDIYLAQYSSTGSLNWIRTAGGYTGDYATCVATDGTDYVYIAGEIQGTNATIKFVGSSITLKCQGSNDIFIAKYTLSGTLVWARRAGGPYYEKALGIALDQNNNVYITGLFTKWAKFGSSTTIYGNSDRDIFTAKYDSNGNFIWVRSASGPGRDEANEITADEEGNVYVTGFYSEGCKFGGQTFSSPNGKKNLFLVKYSTNGDQLWVKTGGGAYNDEGYGVVYHNDRIYVSGEFNSTANFSGKTISTTGSGDILVACYDKSGAVRWLRKAGSKSLDRGRGIAACGGKLLITGQFGNSCTFGNITKGAADSRDIFTACMDTSGTWNWVMTAGGPADLDETLGYEAGIAVCAEPDGDVYTTGAMLNGATFGPYTPKKWTRTDVFLSKIKTTPFETSPVVIQSADAVSRDSAMLPEPMKTKLLQPGSPAEYESANHLFAENVSVYPNPTGGSFKVYVSSEAVGTYELTVWNLSGQEVERRKFSGSEVNIDLSPLDKGTYILMITNGRHAARKKILVQ